LRALITERLNELHERSLRHYLLKTFGLSKIKYDYYTYHLKEEGIKSIETRTLKELCKNLKSPI